MLGGVGLHCEDELMLWKRVLRDLGRLLKLFEKAFGSKSKVS